jgi:hypothetical protein
VGTVPTTAEHLEVPANETVRDSSATVDVTAVDQVPPPRFCAAVKRSGKPCRSRILLEDGRCWVHSVLSTGTPVERGQKGGLVSAQVRREQAKSVRDRLRDKVEAEAELIWRVYREAFDAAVGDGDPDHRARLASVEGVLAQAYGRPPQAIVGDGEQPVTFVLASLLQPAALAAFELEPRRRGRLRAVLRKWGLSSSPGDGCYASVVLERRIEGR